MPDPLNPTSPQTVGAPGLTSATGQPLFGMDPNTMQAFLQALQQMQQGAGPGGQAPDMFRNQALTNPYARQQQMMEASRYGYGPSYSPNIHFMGGLPYKVPGAAQAVNSYSALLGNILASVNAVRQRNAGSKDMISSPAPDSSGGGSNP